MAIPVVYNLRSVRARWTSAIVAVAGIAGTVGVFVAMLSLARGFRATLVSSGSEDNAIVLRSGATAEMIFTASRSTQLIISAVAPARMTMALSSEPEDTSVALKPRASESMATKTPTVPAIPATATIAEVQRALTLRKL